MENPTAGSTHPAENALITPSELVALRGEVFANKATFNSFSLLGSQAKVSGPELARKICATALLALEAAGDIRLEMSKKKTMFGLGSAATITVSPSGQGQAWPEGSYEAALLSHAAALQAKNRNNVRDIIYSVIGKDESSPWHLVINRAYGGLAQRGILAVEAGKILKILPTSRFAVPPELVERLKREDVSALQARLADCEARRPELWKLMWKEIGAGIDARTESSDSE